MSAFLRDPSHSHHDWCAIAYEADRQRPQHVINDVTRIDAPQGLSVLGQQ
jgi:hypothetical protein